MFLISVSSALKPLPGSGQDAAGRSPVPRGAPGPRLHAGAAEGWWWGGVTSFLFGISVLCVGVTLLHGAGVAEPPSEPGRHTAVLSRATRQLGWHLRDLQG